MARIPFFWGAMALSRSEARGWRDAQRDGHHGPQPAALCRHAGTSRSSVARTAYGCATGVHHGCQARWETRVEDPLGVKGSTWGFQRVPRFFYGIIINN